MEYADDNTNTHIVANMEVLDGQPVIKGTRIPVTLIVEEMAGGTTIEEIMREYELKREQIQAALKYAAMALREDVVLVA